MTHWLYPANVKYYDVLAAFECDETFWPINSSVQAGDRVYIYLAAPYKQIGFITEITEIGIDHDTAYAHVREFIKDTAVKKDQRSKQFMRLRRLAVIERSNDSRFTLFHLKQNGLNGMLMGPRKLENNPELLDYIKGGEDGLF